MGWRFSPIRLTGHVYAYIFLKNNTLINPIRAAKIGLILILSKITFINVIY